MKFLTRIIFMIAAIYWCATPSTAHSQEAPALVLQGTHEQVNLENYRGKVVYLDFWASWCDPCRKSFPWMNQMQARYGNNGFKVIAVNLDTSRENADEFLSKIKAKFDIAYDPVGESAEAYKLTVMPSSFLINKQGELVYASKGFNAKEKRAIENKIRRLTGVKQAGVKQVASR